MYGLIVSSCLVTALGFMPTAPTRYGGASSLYMAEKGFKGKNYDPSNHLTFCTIESLIYEHN